MFAKAMQVQGQRGSFQTSTTMRGLSQLGRGVSCDALEAAGVMAPRLAAEASACVSIATAAEAATHMSTDTAARRARPILLWGRARIVADCRVRASSVRAMPTCDGDGRGDVGVGGTDGARSLDGDGSACQLQLQKPRPTPRKARTTEELGGPQRRVARSRREVALCVHAV